MNTQRKLAFVVLFSIVFVPLLSYPITQAQTDIPFPICDSTGDVYRIENGTRTDIEPLPEIDLVSLSLHPLEPNYIILQLAAEPIFDGRHGFYIEIDWTGGLNPNKTYHNAGHLDNSGVANGTLMTIYNNTSGLYTNYTFQESIEVIDKEIYFFIDFAIIFPSLAVKAVIENPRISDYSVWGVYTPITGEVAKSKNGPFPPCQGGLPPCLSFADTMPDSELDIYRDSTTNEATGYYLIGVPITLSIGFIALKRKNSDKKQKF